MKNQYKRYTVKISYWGKKGFTYNPLIILNCKTDEERLIAVNKYVESERAKGNHVRSIKIEGIRVRVTHTPIHQMKFNKDGV